MPESRREAVLGALDAAGIPYRMVEHEAAHTVEAMDRLHLDGGESIPKNLFLRDAKGRRHFLLVADKDCAVDLRALRAILGTSALSFASEERLARFLKLEKGAVTPLGVLNDEERAVEVIFRREWPKSPFSASIPGTTAPPSFSPSRTWKPLSAPTATGFPSCACKGLGGGLRRPRFPCGGSRRHRTPRPGQPAPRDAATPGTALRRRASLHFLERAMFRNGKGGYAKRPHLAMRPCAFAGVTKGI